MSFMATHLSLHIRPPILFTMQLYLICFLRKTVHGVSQCLLGTFDCVRWCRHVFVLRCRDVKKVKMKSLFVCCRLPWLTFRMCFRSPCCAPVVLTEDSQYFSEEEDDTPLLVLNSYSPFSRTYATITSSSPTPFIHLRRLSSISALH